MRRSLAVLLPLALAATPWILALILVAGDRANLDSAWSLLVVGLALLPFVLMHTSPERDLTMSYVWLCLGLLVGSTLIAAALTRHHRQAHRILVAVLWSLAVFEFAAGALYAYVFVRLARTMH